MKKYLIALILGIVIFLGWQQRVNIKEFFTPRETLPQPVALVDVKSNDKQATTTLEKSNTIEKSVEDTKEPIPTKLPTTSYNLAVPFQAQAPFGNWVEPYKEACEEASLIMVDHYLAGTSLSKQQMQDEIDSQISWELEKWGGHFDLTMAQTATLAQAMYNYQTRIITDLTIDKIKAEINAGNPIIIPAAGRELGNPNFRQPGPLYHMLVIKGYLPGKFITNDPGTRNGADYVYSESVLMAAIHDWTGSAPDGGRVGLVLSK